MTRKESEKDSERPHYYSQFWLDVAAGRKIIGAPKTNEEVDTFDQELEPAVIRKPGRNSSGTMSHGYEEAIAHPEVEPEFDADEYAEPEFEELDLEDEVGDEEIPNIVDEIEIPDVDFTTSDEPLEEEVPLEETDEEDFLEELDEDEDEDDLNWHAGRGKKKPKPRGVSPKLPPKLPPKKAKREPRRGF